MLVDSHCHLSLPPLREQIAPVRAAMQAAGVDRALCICTSLQEFDAVHRLALEHPEFWATVGVHPDEQDATEPDVAGLVRLAARPRVVAIGETGLDYYRLAGRSLEQMQWQRERFRVHIHAARASGLPLVVHTRSAGDDTIRLLREEGGGRVSGVLHCFTETQAVADAALDLGLYISFSGILSFRNAQALRDVARRVPLERCLVETDSPYLAPVPHRGKLNQPAYVRLVAEQLAQVKGCSLEEVAQATSRNFDRLFTRVRVTGGTPNEEIQI